MRCSCVTGIVGLMILTIACSGTPMGPATPVESFNSPTSAPTPPGGTAALRISGTATDDDGNAVAGVRVTFVAYDGSSRTFSTRTDSQGFYDIRFDGVRLSGNVIVDGEGYEHYQRFAQSDSNDLVHNVRAYRVKRLTVGDSFSVTVLPSDSSCGGDWEWVCRTLRLTSTSTHAINISLTQTSGTGQTGMELGAAGRFMCCSLIQSVQVNGGQEILVNVLVTRTAADAHSFRLTTSLMPQ